MKAYCIAVVVLIAFAIMSVSAEDQTIPVTWSPFTKDFKMISFSFPVNMKYFSAADEDNTYIFELDITGVKIVGDVNIERLSSSSSATTAWSRSSVSNFNQQAKYEATFPVFGDRGNYARQATVYLTVESIENPSVKVTVTSKTRPQEKIADPTSQSQATFPESLGVFTITTAHNKTDAFYDEDGFELKLENVTVPADNEATLTISDQSAFASSFTRRRNQPQKLCRINNVDVDSSIIKGALSFPKIKLGEFGSTLTITCPEAGIRYPAMNDFAITAFFAGKDETQKRYASQVKVAGSTPFELPWKIVLGVILAIFVVVVVVGGAAAYFLVFKKKQNQQVLLGDDADYDRRV